MGPASEIHLLENLEGGLTMKEEEVEEVEEAQVSTAQKRNAGSERTPKKHKAYPLPHQHTDSHPCTRQPCWGTRVVGTT